MASTGAWNSIKIKGPSSLIFRLAALGGGDSSAPLAGVSATVARGTSNSIAKCFVFMVLIVPIWSVNVVLLGLGKDNLFILLDGVSDQDHIGGTIIMAA